MAYITTTRYGVGWTDPRMLFESQSTHVVSNMIAYDEDAMSVFSKMYVTGCSAEIALNALEVDRGDVFSDDRRAEILAKLEEHRAEVNA